MRLAQKALEIAISQIGRGETEGNNRGAWVREYCRIHQQDYDKWVARERVLLADPTTPTDPLKRKELAALRKKIGPAWCAGFASWNYELAWARIHGFERWMEAPKALRKACPLTRSLSAKRLCKPLQLVLVPEPGDIALWHRGALNAVTGHVGLVSKFRPETGEFFCVEGNRGAFPSRVAEFKHVVGEGGFLGFYRVKE